MSQRLQRMVWIFSLLFACLILCVGGRRLAHFERSVRAQNGENGRDSSIQATTNVSTAPADFQSRCHAPDVVKCVGFDSENEILPFLAADGNGVYRGALDRMVHSSGAGSLRFEIPSISGQNSSGAWTSGLGANFGPGRTLYVQFRERFSPEFLKSDFQGNGWKQVIFHMGHKTCGSIELTTQNSYGRGFPEMYTDCGSRSFVADLHNGDFLFERGDYNCHRSKPTASSCAYYHANEWMTFYYEVKLGSWGRPESSIKAWVAYEGAPYRQFIDERKYRLDFDSSPLDTYNAVTFTPYNTGKPTTPHPLAFVWYDELIVSNRPIAAPAAGQ
ncbi:MAG TPA: hypothetical protein VNH65_13140 [Candidatus Acidoferrum sp.]|nr:hypothetical protein [Candidatus Acidoferrum sp.]